ncbi:hypothetical protein ABRZ10_07195 [Castellaniella ginsengisoli]|uniref:Uncharacterized protein n=1 Tax=Castellaniella ginsengisoli TaxID=546114 RepID=A0AB39DVA5_9BURK
MEIPIILPLRISADTGAKVDHLLVLASDRIAADPEVLVPIYDGTFRLHCPMPDGYTPRMNRWGRELSARVNRRGWLFEINEDSDGISGGWMASCIPPAMYRVFLAAWLASSQARQLELFA